MNNDLKIIKKKYGEKMMHLCRELFSTIIDNSPGALSSILLETFNPSHYLYDDLIENNYIEQFKNYLYHLYHKLKKANERQKDGYKSDPVSLMKRAGYTLYKCTCEEDIQMFKKYYEPREELCTFNGGRLNRCYVYFAIHDNADKLNRSDFTNPNRQDAYGTSVISIQFTRDGSHTLSIKNRYNHTVPNPDATFSNDLDNIIPGLTESFAEYYGMHQIHHNSIDFELSNYVRANDGKFYKYNYEIDNRYFCPGNIIIDNFQATEYLKEKYLIMDYFLLDLANMKIIDWCIDDGLCEYYDSFPESLELDKVKKICIKNNQEGKTIIFTPNNGEDIIVELDKYNRIISYKNNNVKNIASYFLAQNKVLETLTLDSVTTIANYFLKSNRQLKKLSLANVRNIGNNFIAYCECSLTEIYLPNILIIGNNFMTMAYHLSKVSMPKVVEVGSHFCNYNRTITEVEMPSLEIIGNCFLDGNYWLKTISLPSVRKIGENFCAENRGIYEINLPNVEYITDYFLHYNTELTKLDLPRVKSIGDGALRWNNRIISLNLPKIETLGERTLLKSVNIEYFYAPNLINKMNNVELNKLVATSSRTEKVLKKEL